MNSALIVLLLFLAGVFAIWFFVDWFGLWVSKDEMRKQLDTVKIVRGHRTTGKRM